MDVIRPRPDSRPGPPENFTGAVWIDAIVAAGSASRLRANSVHFAPGARTAWHAHINGQTLYVTEGTGRAQERGDRSARSAPETSSCPPPESGIGTARPRTTS